jgi:hypothetical protein
MKHKKNRLNANPLHPNTKTALIMVLSLITLIQAKARKAIKSQRPIAQCLFCLSF